MKAFFVTAALAMLVLLSGPSVYAADVDCQRFSGAIKIPQDAPNALRLPLKGKLLDCNVKVYSYEGGLAGGRNIRVEADFINSSTANTSFSMGAAFFDDHGTLLCCTGKTEVFAVGGGKSGSCQLEISCPRAQFYKIATYQIVFYDDAQTIGKQ